MYLFVDDERVSKREDAVVARSYEEAIEYLKTGDVTEISLDHDLGQGHGKEGIDICKWMSQNDKWPAKVSFHTANPVGRTNMEGEYAFYIKHTYGISPL